MIYKTCAFIFTLLLLFLTTLDSIAAYPDDYPNKLNIIKLLQENKIEELEQGFNKLQSGYEDGKYDEMHIYHAFSAFSNTDPEHKTIFDNWIKTYPESSSAFLAKAYYYHSVGFHSRGYQLITDTSQKKIASMQESFKIAIENALKSLELNKNNIPAYALLISIQMHLGSKSYLTELYNNALKIDPATYIIRYRYMFALQPKWGGSFEKITQVIEEAKKYYSHNPRLKSLEGFIDYAYSADPRSRFDDENYTKRLAFLEKAISKGDHFYYYLTRSLYNSHLKNYEQAKNDLDKADKLSPQNPETLVYRCKANLELKLLDKALADCNTAIKLDRYHSYALSKRARVNYDLNNFEDSVNDYKDYLKYDNDKNTILYSKYMLGFIYLYKIQNYEEAALYNKKVVELDNNIYIDPYYGIAFSLYKLNNCDYIGAAKKYISVCTEQSKCDESRVNWVKHIINQASEKGC